MSGPARCRVQKIIYSQHYIRTARPQDSHGSSGIFGSERSDPKILPMNFQHVGSRAIDVRMGAADVVCETATAVAA